MRSSLKKRPSAPIVSQGEGRRVAIVVARFNSAITERLLAGSLEAFEESGVHEKDIVVTWVPGAFEIPLIAKRFAESGRYDAVICLGAVIRGETAHFEHVATQAASGIMQIMLSTDVPVIFSVLTTENYEQAEARSGKREENGGFTGALTALEMANLSSCV